MYVSVALAVKLFIFSLATRPDWSHFITKSQQAKAMDPMIIGIAVVALSVLLAALVWLKNSSAKDAAPRPRPRYEIRLFIGSWQSIFHKKFHPKFKDACKRFRNNITYCNPQKDPAWTPLSNRQTPFPEAVGGVPVCGGRLLRGSNRTRKTTNR